MARVDKKAIILQCIISEYIKTTAPIGSEHLQSVINMEISSATIRNYFKQMVEEGVLVQFHISGGRVPSALALKQFWIDRLSALESIQISDTDNIAEAAKEFKISSILRINESDKLLGSYMAGSKFVVAEFEKGEVLLRGDAHTKAFFDEFVGLEASQIKDLAARYNASEIFLKLSEYLLSKGTHVSNKEELLEIAKSDDNWAREKMSWFLDGTAASQVGRGIYFRNLIPEGFMAVKTEAKIGDKSGEILYVGHLSRDFDGFLCAIN